MDKIKQAVILAGGRGERLRPLTNAIPKPMAPVNGRPFLEYLIELLRTNGIEEIILLVGYLNEKIVEHFGNGLNFGVKINYSIGKIDDDTGRRLKRAKDMLAGTFICMYGDNYWPMDLAKMMEVYEKNNTLAMMVLYNNRDGGGEYGFENNIRIENNGLISRYDPARKSSDLNALDVGTFILKKEFVDEMPEHNFHFQNEFLPELISTKRMSGYGIDHPYYSITNMNKLNEMREFLRTKKVVFLDRDGVINRKMPKGDYVKKWEEFKFLPGAIDAIKKLSSAGFDVFIVTNQRGISRGIMSERDLGLVHNRMVLELESAGASISGIYYCPHGKQDECFCRKPNPGMLIRAARDHKLDLSRSIIIGDDETDIEAGKTVGAKTFRVTPENNLLKITRLYILS